MANQTPFGKFLVSCSITHAAAAQALGITESYVGMLARGGATPKLALAGRIEAWSRRFDHGKSVVTMQSWLPWCA